MRFIRQAFFFILTQISHVGDSAILIVSLLFTLFLSVLKRLRKPFKRKKRLKKQSGTLFLYSLSWLIKLKYFTLGIIFSFLFCFLPILALIFTQTLPNLNQLSQNFVPQTTKIYDRNGVLLYSIYANQNRTLVTLSDIPKSLQNATIAIEDKNFYKNPGFDIQAILRAAIADITTHNFQGGSTITQQLIKSSLLTPQVSIVRKIQEAILAFWSERLYSKNQILTMYFNYVAYGGTSWGVEAASQTYFNKNVRDVDVAQAAFLAGMPQAPTTYSPYGMYPNLWKKRQLDVLKRMRELGYITQDEEKTARDEKLEFQNPDSPIIAPHFVMYVKDLLEKKYGTLLVEKGGLRIITTLDIKTQNMAQSVVTNEVNHDAYLNLSNGATLVTNPQNGDILAMVGSSNYHDPRDGNFNVTTALRQPGSTMKIVTYSAALAHGFTAASILDDSPVSFPSASGAYSPVNYDGKFRGRVPLRIAFANSLNIPAVKTLNSIGVQTFIDLAKRMGISSLDQENNYYGLSVTLGGMDATMLDMATAYGTVANSGVRTNLNPLLKVTDNAGNVLEEKNNTPGITVLDKGITFIVSNILSDNNARSMEFGPNSPLVIPDHTVSVKTGTSDDKRDNWTIGYTKDKLVAVWVGNNDNTPMSPTLASGITGAAPIWHGIMANLLQGQPDNKPTPPENIVTRFCNGKEEYFLKGTETSANCSPLPSVTPTISQTVTLPVTPISPPSLPRPTIKVIHLLHRK